MFNNFYLFNRIGRMGSSWCTADPIEQFNPVPKGKYRISNATSHNFRVKTSRIQVNVSGGAHLKEIHEGVEANKDNPGLKAGKKDERKMDFNAKDVIANEVLTPKSSIEVSIPAEGALIIVEREKEEGLKEFNDIMDITFDKSGGGYLYYYENEKNTRVLKDKLLPGRQFVFASGSTGGSEFINARYPPLMVGRCKICPQDTLCKGHQYNTKTHSFVKLK